MSRFSQAEAEERGWVLAHERDQFDVTTSGTQGETRTTPASVRFEKTINGQNVSVEGESMGLALERIAALEAHLDSLPETAPGTLTGVPEAPTGELDENDERVLDEDGHPVSAVLRTVRTPEGDFTEEEWSNRSRVNDVIVTDEGQQHLSGQTLEEGGDLAAVDRAIAERDRVSQDIENRRVRNPEDAVQQRQVETSTADAIDSPGIGAGGVLRIPAEDEDPAESAARMTERGQAKEVERVTETEDGFGRRALPDEDVDLTGMDVGFGRHGDLGSENPPPGHIESFVEGEKERGESEPEAATTEGPTAQVVAEERQAGIDATIESTTEKRDEEGSAAADEDAAVAEARDAGAEATQEQADENTGGESSASAPQDTEHPETADGAQEPAASETPAAVEPPTEEQHDPFTEKDDIDATDAAIAHAKEKGIELSEVTGTGKDGRITADDVDKHAEAK